MYMCLNNFMCTTCIQELKEDRTEHWIPGGKKNLQVVVSYHGGAGN